MSFPRSQQAHWIPASAAVHHTGAGGPALLPGMDHGAARKGEQGARKREEERREEEERGRRERREEGGRRGRKKREEEEGEVKREEEEGEVKRGEEEGEVKREEEEEQERCLGKAKRQEAGGISVRLGKGEKREEESEDLGARGRQGEEKANNGQRTEHVKTGHVKTDRFCGHFRGHFRGHPRGTFRGAFRGESSKG